MSVDLEERLRVFRTTLDDAIAQDLARPRAVQAARPSRRPVVVLVAASLIAVGALAAVASTRNETDPDVYTPVESAGRAPSTVEPLPSTIPPAPTTAAENTETTTATTGAAPVVLNRLAVGDSVMKGAAPALAEAGFVVDAVESRQFSDGAELAHTLQAQQRLGDVVVVHLGTNGDIGPNALDTLMNALNDVPHVLLITDGGDMTWTATNNAALYEAAATHDNVELLDWAGLAAGCPGDCLYPDGVHLRPDGQTFYTKLINAAINDGLNN